MFGQQKSRNDAQRKSWDWRGSFGISAWGRMKEVFQEVRSRKGPWRGVLSLAGTAPSRGVGAPAASSLLLIPAVGLSR